MFQFPVTPVRQLPRDARATRDRRARRRSGRVARRGRALGRGTLNGALDIKTPHFQWELFFRR